MDDIQASQPYLMVLFTLKRVMRSKDVESISKLVDTTLKRHFFIKREGTFMRVKSTALLLAKSWLEVRAPYTLDSSSLNRRLHVYEFTGLSYRQ